MQSVLWPAVPLRSLAVYGDIMVWGLKGQPWSGKASEREVLPGCHPTPGKPASLDESPSPLGPKMC